MGRWYSQHRPYDGPVQLCKHGTSAVVCIQLPLCKSTEGLAAEHRVLQHRVVTIGWILHKYGCSLQRRCHDELEVLQHALGSVVACLRVLIQLQATHT